MACIGVGLIGLWIDRDGLNRWLIAPSVWAASVCILAGGIGPMIMVAFSEDAEGMGLGSMQVAMILGYIAFFGAYRLLRPSMSRIPPFRLILDAQPRLRNALFTAGLLCLAFAIVERVVGAVTGAHDRGMAGADAAHQVFGVWTYFTAFRRLLTVGFILAPVVWIYGNLFTRGFVLVSVIVVAGLGFLEGSRHAALVPFVGLIIGYFGFSARPKVRIEYVAWAALPLVIFLFIFLDHFRNTSIFHQESLADPIRRLEAVSQARERSKDLEGTGVYLLGRRLMGTVDPLIFTLTPTAIPHAGFDSMDAIFWLYVPYFFYPYRPIMVDGKFIGERYLGYALIRTSIGSSLTGDWYRRFGWVGVVIGMCLAGAFFALYIRLLAFGFKRQQLWAIACWLLLTELMLKDANLTVLSGIWYLLYDIPKHAVPLIAFLFLGRFATSLLPTGNALKPLRTPSPRQSPGRPAYRPSPSTL